MKNVKVKMAFLSLLGLIFPLGAIWAPFFVRTSDEESRKFRKKYVLAHLLVGVALFAITCKPWADFMQRMGAGANGFEGVNFSLMLLPALGIIVVSLGTGLYQLRRK